MYENSPEYFKKFQKRFKYNICEMETKLGNITTENYAYGYHSSATVIEGCTLGSNHYHVVYEFGSQDDSIVNFLYVLAVIPCLVNCFKLLIQPTQKDFFKCGAIISRLQVALEYLSKSTSCSVTNNQKQLPVPLSEATAKSISTSTANKRSSTVPDVTIKRFCQLMLGENSSTLYHIMDFLLSGHGSFVQETSISFITFQFCKNSYSKNVVA